MPSRAGRILAKNCAAFPLSGQAADISCEAKRNNPRHSILVTIVYSGKRGADRSIDQEKYKRGIEDLIYACKASGARKQ